MNGNRANTSALRCQSDPLSNSPSYARRAPRCPAYLSVIITALCVVHLLLPIERGFPVLRIAGYPITLTLLISVLSMLVLLIESNGRIITSFPKRYVPYQLVVAWVFLVSAFVSRDVTAGLFVVLSYSATFILDFLIIYHLFKRGFRQQFVNILCVVISTAALIGIIEGVFRYYLPCYRTWFLMYNYQAMQYAMIRPDFRALGTLGNPIVYSAAMAMSFPFTLEIRHRLLRFLMAGLLLTATMLAVSTTTAIMWLVLLAGLFLISRRKTRLILSIIAMIALLAILLTLRFSKEAMGYLVSGWSREFAFGDLANDQFLNIRIRRDLLLWTLTRFGGDLSFSSILFGYGLKSAIQAVQALSLSRLSTFDNTYATILFESGILGLISFLAMAFNVLVGYRWAIRKSLHWYSILSLLMAGMAFMAVYYATFNFVWVASVAALASDARLKRQSDAVLR